MPPRTKGGAKRASKAEDKTLKRKRENEDHERLRKLIDEFVRYAALIPKRVNYPTNYWPHVGSQSSTGQDFYRPTSLRGHLFWPTSFPLRDPDRCPSARDPARPPGQRPARRGQDGQRQDTCLSNSCTREALPLKMDKLRWIGCPHHLSDS